MNSIVFVSWSLEPVYIYCLCITNGVLCFSDLCDTHMTLSYYVLLLNSFIKESVCNNCMLLTMNRQLTHWLRVTKHYTYHNDWGDKLATIFTRKIILQLLIRSSVFPKPLTFQIPMYHNTIFVNNNCKVISYHNLIQAYLIHNPLYTSD